jgi:hypothetical protein
MHDLGQGGFHSRATSGRENDGGERGLAHRRAPSGPKNISGRTIARRLPYSTRFLLVFSFDGTLVDSVPDLHAGLITVNSGAANLRRRQG